MSESPGNVYLGQHMSIVSEMLVRYEGFLSAVDGNNHTVTLNRVRCFGTEDRPVELKIDPIQMTYAEITFSASSIREMHLMPKLDETKASVLSADPAVTSIEAKKLCPPYDINNNKFDQTIGHERKHVPTKDSWRNVPFRRPDPFKPRDNVPKLLREALVTESKQESALSLYSLAQELCGKPAFSSSDTDSSSISTTDAEMMMKGNGRGFANPCYVDPTGKALEQNGYKAAPLGHAFGYAPKTDYVKSQGYGKPRFGSEQFDARPGQHQNKFPQKAAKFNADYDFETANRMFAEIAIGDPKDIKDDKSEGAPKAKDVQLPDEDVKQNKVFYKKSAFFDDISSDDKDRRSGKDVRPDWHIQRKTDGDTFGPGTHEVISRHARHNNDIHQRHARVDGAAH